MRYPPEQKERTRRRIVEAAGRVLRRRGYAAAGVDALAAEAGVTSGAVYGHFRGKEDVLAEVVAEATKAAESVREAGLHGLAGRDWLVAMLRRYLSREHHRAVETGCPIPALVSELAHAGAEPRRAFDDAIRSLVERMADKCPDGAARERALASLALAVGGMSLARAAGDEGLIDELLAACRGFGAEALLEHEPGEAA